MTCANWGLTICSVVILVLTLWPALLGKAVSMWIIVIAAILILIISWTGVKCKWCEMAKEKELKVVSKKKK